MLMKEIKEDTNIWKDIPYSWIEKNQYCQNDYTTQGNLQIQHNSYQITNGIFHRTENPKTSVETQKTLNSKAIQIKKKRGEESGSLTSDCTTKLRSSKQYGIGTKIEI